jgi:hypothetical protein
MRIPGSVSFWLVALSLGLGGTATLADGPALAGEGGRARLGSGIESRRIPRTEVRTPSPRPDVERSIRRLEREARRRTDEGAIRRSGTQGDLERYRIREHRRDRLSELSEEISAAPPTVTEQVERDLDRVLDRADFERRVQALEHELRRRERAERVELDASR